MKKALECALILTRKHQLLGDKIALSTDYLKKIELKDKQSEINKQMIEFLVELQEFVEFIRVNQELRLMYVELVNYYFTQIHHQINFYEIELDRLEFESKFSINMINQFNQNEEPTKGYSIFIWHIRSYYICDFYLSILWDGYFFYRVCKKSYDIRGYTCSGSRI